MELPIILLAAAVIAIGAVGWLREHRTWHTIYAIPARDPAQALALHRELRSAGIRSRYKLAHGGILLHRGASSLGQTAQVQVHRDDLEGTRAVRAAARSDGRGR